MNIQTCVPRTEQTIRAIQITSSFSWQEANSLNKVKRIENPDSENKFYIQVENPLGAFEYAALGDWIVEFPSKLWHKRTNQQFEKEYKLKEI